MIVNKPTSNASTVEKTTTDKTVRTQMVTNSLETCKMAGIVLVRDVMSKEVKVVRPDTSIKEVVATMNKFSIGSVIVIQGDRPVGIITERDILQRLVEPCLAPESITARQVMTSPLFTISEEASIEETAQLMARKKVKRLPVISGGKLVGVITYTDIVTKVPTMLSILEELVRPQHRSY
jgi:CBS domain-containing protein